jgi:DNA-binding beta-propeller fold protein YncE
MRTLGVLGVLLAGGCGDGAVAAPEPERPAKVYVCAERASTLEVLDGKTLESVRIIRTGEGRTPHNVTVSPRGDRVWVTNAHTPALEPDEVLVLDPTTDAILARVELDLGAFVAHVLLSPDGSIAYVSGYGSNVIYRIDAASLTRLADVHLPLQAAPHGLRFSDDGAFLYTANGVGTVGEIDTVTGLHVRDFALPGAAIQVASRGDHVFATVFSPPGVARITRSTATVDWWPLPSAMRGPAQLELHADGKRLLVAEQGERTLAGTHLLVLDVETGAVMAANDVGEGPHGVALAEGGRFAYVTGSYDNSLTVVDLDKGLAVQTTGVGRGPFGVATWSPPRAR